MTASQFEKDRQEFEQCFLNSNKDIDINLYRKKVQAVYVSDDYAISAYPYESLNVENVWYGWRIARSAKT